MKKSRLYCSLVLCYLVVSMANSVSARTLLKVGNKPVNIVLPADAIPSEKTAAEQLQKYLHQITGKRHAIVSEADAASTQPQILVGISGKVKQLTPEVSWDNLGRDTIVLKTKGDSLILAGERPRGALYAVYQFLEDVAGCRWWTPTERYIPQKETFDIPELNVVYTPPFYYRQMHVVGFSWQKDPEFQTIMRQNGQHQIQDENWGGHYKALGFVHTFDLLIPPKQYFASHPEWFSGANNKGLPSTASSKMPLPQKSQLCVSNDEMRAELTKNALALIEKNPQAGIIDISQNDNRNYCRCAACLKLYEQEGSWSGPYINFVNKVAADIQQKYPNFIVRTFAYEGTEKPPATIKPAANVMIQLAPINRDLGRPINSQANAVMRDNLIKWKEISSQLFIWDYATNFHFYLMPHPNISSLAHDLRFLTRNNVKAMYIEADNLSNGVGDFVQLRAWLTAKLLWNPHLNQDELTDTFLRGYYGEAAPHLKEYLETLYDSFSSRNDKLTTYNHHFAFLSIEVMNELTKHFDAALESVKSNEIHWQRVRRERLSLDTCWIKFYKALKANAAKENAPFLGPADPEQAFNELKANFAKYKKEGHAVKQRSYAQLLPILATGIKPSAPLPTEIGPATEGDFIDLPAGAFNLVKGEATLVEDERASTGMAARLGASGNLNIWSAQTYLGSYSMLFKDDSWRAYAVLRFEFKPGAQTTAPIAHAGIHDGIERKYLTQKRVYRSELKSNEYQVYDLGELIPNGNNRLFITTLNNPDVEAIYVDRVILTRR